MLYPILRFITYNIDCTNILWFFFVPQLSVFSLFVTALEITLISAIIGESQREFISQQIHRLSVRHAVWPASIIFQGKVKSMGIIMSTYWTDWTTISRKDASISEKEDALHWKDTLYAQSPQQNLRNLGPTSLLIHNILWIFIDYFLLPNFKNGSPEVSSAQTMELCLKKGRFHNLDKSLCLKRLKTLTKHRTKCVRSQWAYQERWNNVALRSSLRIEKFFMADQVSSFISPPFCIWTRVFEGTQMDGVFRTAV